MHKPPLVSQIIRSSWLSLISLPSSVVKGVPSGRFFTMILPPWILSASKACMGWPISNMIYWVTSTTLLMGRTPMDFKRFCSHSGDSLTVTFSSVNPVYLGQALGFSMEISMGKLRELTLKSKSLGSIRAEQGMWLTSRAACRSRATP